MRRSSVVGISLVYTARPAKDIRGLDPKVQERIGNALRRFQTKGLDGVDRVTSQGLTLDPRSKNNLMGIA